MPNNFMSDIWTEKYRPQRLGEIIGQENSVRRLQTLIEKKSLPHCLFVGPAGVGKTTCALALAREFWGDSWKSNFLELNASDERGIDTIRVKVKDFARTMPLTGHFKIVYLDEADALTRDAQQALRRIMEDFSEGCRFILAGNYSSRIIPPIQSRCAIFKFAPLSQGVVVQFLQQVVNAEGIHIENGALEAIHEISAGDLRRAVNLLQSSAFDGQVTAEKIFVLSNRDPARVSKMLAHAMQAQFKEAQAVLIELLAELTGEDVVKEVHNQALQLQLPSDQKLQLLEAIAEAEFRITEGSDPRIQLEALLARIQAARVSKGT